MRRPKRSTKSRNQEDAIAADDRRTNDRRPPKVEPTFVWVSLEERIQGRLVDESDGGIGLLVPSGQPFVIGFQVRVEMQDRRRTAIVVYSHETDDGEHRLGLEWV